MQQQISIEVPSIASVSGVLDVPANAQSCYVFAHGAGAGMRHVFMEALATKLAGHGIAVLRYQFPAMEAGSRRPDLPATAHATVRAAVSTAAARMPGLALFAGGKSFGARMTSQAQALQPLERVMGLAFVGFPLHPEGAPSTKRADHLADVRIPLLFLQGTRDGLADLTLLSEVTTSLRQAEVEIVDDADHAFHVRRASGSNDQAVLDRLASRMALWFQKIAGSADAARSSSA